MKQIQFSVQVDNKNQVKDLEKDVKKLDDTTKKTSKSQEGLNTSLKAGSQAMATFQGPLGPIAGRLSSMGSLLRTLTSATSAWISRLGALRVALLATGIGAIVVALGTLAGAFLSTQDGVDALNSVLVPLQTSLGRLWGVIQNVSVALREWRLADAVQELLGLRDAVREGWEQGQNLNDMQIELEKSTIAWTRSQAQLNSVIAESRQVVQDNTRDLEEREEALDNAQEAIRRRAEEEQRLIEQEIAIIKSRQDINDTSREDLQELADLEARLIQVRTSASNEERRLQRDRDRLAQERYEIEQDQLDRQNRLIEARREEQRLGLEEIQNERERLEELKQIRLEEAEMERELRIREAAEEIEDWEQFLLEKEIITQEFENRRTEIENENAEARKDIAKAEADAKIELQMEVAQTFGAISRLVGEQTALGKALGVASATIDTYVGANKALAQGGILGPVAAAGIIATGLANVRQIMSTEVPSIQGQPLGTPAQPPQRTQIPQPSFQPQALETVGTVFNGNQDDQRVYVVESDITETQRKVQVTESSAVV